MATWNCFTLCLRRHSAKARLTGWPVYFVEVTPCTSLVTVCAAVHWDYQTPILILYTTFHRGMKQWKVIRVPRFLSLPYWVGKAPQRIDNIDIFFADMQLRGAPFGPVKMELQVMIRNYIHRFAPEIIEPSEPLASSWTLTTKNTPTSLQWRKMTT